MKLLVEGSGAASIAVLMYNKIPTQGKKVAVILSELSLETKNHAHINDIEIKLIEAGYHVTKKM
jgi:threonine dehydratase